MKKATELINDLKNNKYDELLNDLYVDESLLEYQRNRYVAALKNIFHYMVIMKLKFIVLQVEVKLAVIILTINMVVY